MLYCAFALLNVSRQVMIINIYLIFIHAKLLISIEIDVVKVGIFGFFKPLAASSV